MIFIPLSHILHVIVLSYDPTLTAAADIADAAFLNSRLLVSSSDGLYLSELPWLKANGTVPPSATISTPNGAPDMLCTAEL